MRGEYVSGQVSVGHLEMTYLCVFFQPLALGDEDFEIASKSLSHVC